jgi:hypothetical protein
MHWLNYFFYFYSCTGSTNILAILKLWGTVWYYWSKDNLLLYEQSVKFCWIFSVNHELITCDKEYTSKLIEIYRQKCRCINCYIGWIIESVLFWILYIIWGIFYIHVVLGAGYTAIFWWWVVSILFMIGSDCWD